MHKIRRKIIAAQQDSINNSEEEDISFANIQKPRIEIYERRQRSVGDALKIKEKSLSLDEQSIEKSLDNYTIDGSIQMIAEELETVKNIKVLNGYFTKNGSVATPSASQTGYLLKVVSRGETSNTQQSPQNNLGQLHAAGKNIRQNYNTQNAITGGGP